MSEQYWEELYQKGDTRWEKGEPSPGLVDFLAARPALPKGTVLVPGCGTGHDARAWARHGHTVTGMDIAPSAIEASRAKTASAGLTIDFRQGNFLHDEPFRRFDYIFEHTLFCAIQPNQRPDYVRALSRWLLPQGFYVAVFYLIPDEDGPPFGTTRENVRSFFSPSFELLEDWVPRSYPNRTDLEWMTIWKPS